MKKAIYLRILQLKYEWKSTVLWLLFPFIATVVIYQSLLSFVDDSKIPIGVVLEDDSSYALEVMERLEQVEYLDVRPMKKSEALRLLEQHELDSVFVIRRKYEENIKLGRKKIVEAYASNRSYAYEAVREIVSSVVMEQALRSKTVHDIEQLLQDYGSKALFDEQAIETKVQERQLEADLIQIPFSFFEMEHESMEKQPFISAWVIWASFTVLSTFFLFDWLVKDRQAFARLRWSLSIISYKYYALWLFAIYFVLFFVIDLLALMLFAYELSIWTIAMLCLFRLTLNAYVFIVASLSKNTLTYYILSILFTLLFALTSGGIVPIRDSGVVHQILSTVHPLYALLKLEIPIIGMLLCSIFFLLYGRLRNA
ncbi:ABC transporter permease [Bacillus ndiopicus]|uniref:ABC transporter permease n=1 Tax=Bacillus ndiopicus TaxID=1347368 RepID=UPI0005AA9F29|nr:ABC transporter permease [Bacillus ndiopicus]